MRAMNPDSLMDRMGIEVLEATPDRLVATMPVAGQHPALRPAPRRRLGGARRDAGVDRRRPARRPRQGGRRPRHQRHPPPGGPLGPGDRHGHADQPGPHPGLLRGRRHRRPGPPGLHEPDHLPDPGCRTRAPDATAPRARRTAVPTAPVRRWSAPGLPLVKGWSKRPGTGPLGRCRLTERRRQRPPRGRHAWARAPCTPPPLSRRRPRRVRRRRRDPGARRPRPFGLAPGRPRGLGRGGRRRRRRQGRARRRVEPVRRARRADRCPRRHPSSAEVDRAYAPRAAVPGPVPAGLASRPLGDHRRHASSPAALHLARRATWGATPALVAEIAARGATAWLDAQLNPLSAVPDTAMDQLVADHVAAPGPEDVGGARPVLPEQHRRPRLRRARCLRRPGPVVAPPAARGDGRLLDQPPRRHRPLGRRLGQRAPLPARRHPALRPRPLRRHARGRGQAPGDARPARQRVVDQAGPQRELRPRGARAAHRRGRRRLPRERHPPLGAGPDRHVHRRRVRRVPTTARSATTRAP